jgi:stringent starvation protein B
MHEWMTDNKQTPHIVVNAFFDGVSVPAEHIKDGKIILNISDSAAHNLKLSNEAISFRARFGGVPFDVWAPMQSVLGIYARETGQGMIFSHDTERSSAKESGQELEDTRSRPHLTIVK